MIKLLHVDDEADILEIAKISLEFHGSFDVTSCTSGREALLAAKESAPDMVLLDFMMPKLSGPETLAELRQLPGLNCVPTVFMTARAEENDHEKLWAVGAVDVISKPFDPMTLGQRLEQAYGKVASFTA